LNLTVTFAVVHWLYHRRTGRHFAGGESCPENSNLP